MEIIKTREDLDKLRQRANFITAANYSMEHHHHPHSHPHHHQLMDLDAAAARHVARPMPVLRMKTATNAESGEIASATLLMINEPSPTASHNNNHRQLTTTPSVQYVLVDPTAASAAVSSSSSSSSSSNHAHLDFIGSLPPPPPPHLTNTFLNSVPSRDVSIHLQRIPFFIEAFSRNFLKDLYYLKYGRIF